MGHIPLFEINLEYADIIEILDNLYINIEKTNSNRIKNIYRILDKHKDNIDLSSSSGSQKFIKIRLRHEQWVKIIECCQPNNLLIDHLEGKISFLKKYRQSTTF
jgi:hypothetical protein